MLPMRAPDDDRAPAARMLRAPNVNALWAELLVEELLRQGVGFFVVCPGSRSTPLALAVAGAVQDGRAEWVVHPDERAAAFVALGWGRATGSPAAVVTTSGSAVAHLFPAVVEADAAGVPLLLLTADRPPELRETGANQTIRQPGLFGGYVRWSFDVPPPTAEVDPAFVLTTAAHAVHRTLSPAGPVHLNLAFREPLGLEPDGTDVAALLAPFSPWLGGPAPYSLRLSPLPWVDSIIETVPARALLDAERGLVVVGPTADTKVIGAAAVLAHVLGWPLLSDVASQGRLCALGGTVPRFDSVLASSGFAAAHSPTAVIQIGGRPVSKRLLALIDAARPEPFLIVRLGQQRQDPSHRVTHAMEAPLAAACFALADAVQFERDEMPGARPYGEESGWLRAWRLASDAAGLAVDEAVGRTISEPFVARAIASKAPEGSALVLAASMPVRDMDMLAPADGPDILVFANRGASGIDGTLATAHGVARGLRSPTVALVGDLAMLHDQTSLMLLRSGPPVVVVVVNNDGGGIFHHLPVARGPHAVDAETFEAVFGTPHGLTFEHAAAQVGLAYHAPTTSDAFEAALDAALASGQSAVIEVRTDRAESAALRTRILDAVREAVDATLEP